jgi:hypothetical protein
MSGLGSPRARRFLVLAPFVFILVGVLLVTSASQVAADADNPGVLAPTMAYGRPYSDWSPEFWKWVLGEGLEPLLDDTGALCAAGQSGAVWYLAGSWIGDVARTCAIPAGKAIFIPVQNNVYLGFPYPEVYDEAAVRADLAAGLDAQGTPTASIDGVPIVSFDNYRVQSPAFDADVGPNPFGVPDKTGPNVDDGWYLMLAPLPSGDHTVTFTSWGSTITYDLTIVPTYNAGVEDPANPFGRSYSQWAPEFWKWVLGEGLAPLLDDTGALCASGQSGSVWFLAGSWIGNVTRACTIPADKAIFVPVQNNVYLGFPYPEVYDEAAVRADLAQTLDEQCTPIAEIDGRTIGDMDQYRVQSPAFDADVGPNPFGVPDKTGPNVDDGWYLMLSPMAMGQHTVTFSSWGSMITYNLTITPSTVGSVGGVAVGHVGYDDGAVLRWVPRESYGAR